MGSDAQLEVSSMDNHLKQVTSKEQGSIFQPIVEAVSQTMNLPVSVWVPDEQGQALRIAAAVRLPSAYVSEAVLSLSEKSVTGETFRTRQVTIARDVLSDDRWKYKDIAQKEGWRSVLCVPIEVHDTVIGVINVYTFEIHDFSDYEQHLLAAYARQIGLTLEVDRSRRTLTHLLDIGNKFKELITEQPKAVLEEIVKRACEVTGADCAVIYPYDVVHEEFHDVQSVAHHGLWHPSDLKSKPREDGLGAFIVRNKELVVPNIAERDRTLFDSAFISREGIQAFMGISLAVAGKVLGILYVDFRTPHEFSAEEQDTIRLFAHQAAIAIDNSRLYQQATTRVEALRKLHEIGPTLVSTSGGTEGLDDILKRIVQDAQDVLSADLVDLYQYIQSRDEYILPPLQVGTRYDPFVPKDKVYPGDVVCTIVKGRQSRYFSDARLEPTLTRPYSRPDAPAARFVIREGIKSTATVPLIVGTEVVGVLFASYRTPQAFPQQQQELIGLFASQAAIAIRNARLFEQRRALQEIARDITGTLGKDELLQKILTRSLELLGCEAGAVALLNKVTNRLEFHYPVGKQSSWSVAFGKGLVGTAAKTRMPVRVGDVKQDPRYIAHVRKTRSELDVPMLVGEELVGVLNAESTRYNAFDEDSEELAVTLAGQAAVALHNVALFQQRAALVDIARDIVSELDRDALIQKIIERSTGLIGCETGAVGLVDPNTNAVIYKYGFGLAAETLQPIPHGKGLTGKAIATGKPVRVGNVRKVMGYIKHLPSTKSELIVPLKVRQAVLGVLDFQSPRLDAFDDHAEEFAIELAGHAAVAIYNAGLFEQRQALQEIARDITSELDPNELLRQILRRSLELLRCPVGSIAMWNKARGTLEYKLAIGKDLRLSWPVDKGLMTMAAREGQAVRVADVTKPPWRDLYVAHVANTRSELDVPLLLGKELVGVLNMESPLHDAFSEEDERLAMALASQAAVALYNAALFEQRSTLVDFGQAVTSGIRLREDEVLRLIYDQASKLMDTDNMYIALYDETTDTVRFPLAFVEAKRIDTEQDEGWQPRKAGKGRTEDIIRTKKPIFHANKAESEAWYAQPEHKEYTGGFIWASWLGVPMMVGEKVLGVIATYHPTQDYVYGEDDLEILQAMANQAAIALDNAHMFYDFNRRLGALVEFGQAVTSGIRLQEGAILDLTHKQASKLMDTDNMYIALYDETTDTVRFPLAFVDGKRIDVEREESWQPRRAGKGRTEHIIRTRQPLFHVTGEEGAKWYAQPGHEEYVGAVWGSWLGVPMMVGERVLGVIATYHPTRDYVYSGDDLVVLQGMAEQAAIALDNAHMFYDVNRRLEALVNFGQAVASRIHLRQDEVLALIRSQAGGLMDTDNMYIALYDEATDTVRFESVWVDGKQVDVATAQGWQPRTGGQGRTEWIIRNRQPILTVTQAEGEAWFKQPGRKDYVGGQVWPSWMGVPMMIGQKVLGVISVYHLTQEYAYGKDDLQVLSSMANQAAIALENARLYYDVNQRLERRVKEITALRDIETAIAATVRVPDLETVLQSILERSVEVTKASAGNFMWFNVTSGRLEMRAAVNMPDGWQGISQGLGEGIVGLAARQWKPILVEDTKSPDWAGIYLGFIPNMRSELAVPVVDQDELLGLLNVEHREPRQFDEEDRKLLEAAATQAVIAIRNVQNLQTMKEAEKWKTLGQVARGLAHRVGNKAGMVRVKVKELSGMVSPGATVTDILQTMERNSKYLVDLADELLKPTRALHETLERHQINLLIQDAVRNADIGSDVEVKPDLAQNLPEVMANKFFVETFLELMVNADRAMRKSPQKRLEVSSKLAPDGWVEVSVKDTGCGIPLARRSKIFDLFYVGGENEEGEEEVAEEKQVAEYRQGVGLWWVKTFLSDIGAQLTFETEVSKGSTFVVRLPPAPDNQQLLSDQ